MRRISQVAAFVAILAVSLAVQAQEGLRDRDPVLEGAKKVASDLQAASFHYGPWYLLSRFQIADLGYGQQYFGGTSTGGGLSLAASAPQRLYFVPQRHMVFAGEVVPQYAWVQQSGKHNQFGYNTRGDAEMIFNHLFLDFYGGHANELRPQPGEINRVVTLKERQAGLSGELKYSSRTSALFSARYRDARYPLDRLQPDKIRDLLTDLNRTEHSYRISALHKTFPLTSIILAVEQSRYAFTNVPTRDAKREYAGAGFISDSGTGVFRFEAGPAHLTFKQPGLKEFSGVLVNANASHRLGDRWRIGATATRDLDFSIYGNNNYYVLDRLGVAGDWAATRRLTIRLTSELGRDLYDVSVNGQPLRRDRISWNAIGWNYALRRLRGGFDVGYYDRTTNVIDAERTNGIRTIVHLSFTP